MRRSLPLRAAGRPCPAMPPATFREALQAWERSAGGQARWRAWLAPQSVLAGFTRWRGRLSSPGWRPRIPKIHGTAGSEQT